MRNFLIQYTTKTGITHLVNIQARSRKEAIKIVKGWEEVRSVE